MDSIKLSPRLSAAVSFIDKNARVADIGTDHGYIPVWLAQNGYASFIAASDISKAPLERAVKSAEKYAVSEKIDFRLGAGLDRFNEGEADTFVIAGMGGETIASIIEAAPWCRRCRLILQPMSRREKLGEYLLSAGLKLVGEKLAKENGEIYSVLCVDGEEGSQPHFCGQYISEFPFSQRDPLLPEYLSVLLSRLERAYTGARVSSRCDDRLRSEKLFAAMTEIQKIKGDYGL